MNKYKKFSDQAQEQRRKHQMCERKRGYASMREAEYGAGNQRVYHCPYCNLWHRSAALARLVSRVAPKKSKLA